MEPVTLRINFLSHRQNWEVRKKPNRFFVSQSGLKEPGQIHVLKIGERFQRKLKNLRNYYGFQKFGLVSVSQSRTDMQTFKAASISFMVKPAIFTIKRFENQTKFSNFQWVGVVWRNNAFEIYPLSFWTGSRFFMSQSGLKDSGQARETLLFLLF